MTVVSLRQEKDQCFHNKLIATRFFEGNYEYLTSGHLFVFLFVCLGEE